MQVTPTITNHIIHWTAVAESRTGVQFLSIDNPAPIAPPGSEKVMTLFGMLKWAALIICIFAIVIGAALWALKARRGDDSDGISKVGIALVATIIISFSATLVGFLAGF